MSETTTKTTKTVTIENRGGFHDDSYFKDSWDSWDNAMKDVVQKWDRDIPSSTRSNLNNATTKTTTTSTVSSLPATETRNIYRQIRSSNVTSDDSQAVSCTEEDDKFKIVVDVKDFKPDGINVKVVDDKIVVEGKIEKKEGNSVSTQTFVRRFMLPPSVDFAKISSALSKDGVLKINAPKLNSMVSKTSRTVTIETRGAFHQDSYFKDCRENMETAMKEVIKKRDSSLLSNTRLSVYEIYRKIRSSNVTSNDLQAVSSILYEDKFQVLIDVKDFKPGSVTVKLAEGKIVVEGKIETKEGKLVSTQTFVRRFTPPSSVDFARITCVLSNDGILKVNVPKQGTMAQATYKSVQKIDLASRGGFYEDSFFEESKEDWETALKNVIQKYDSNILGSTNVPTVEIYRKIRSANVNAAESQAASFTGEEEKLLILMDVKDFKAGSLDVTLIDGKIVVEGKIDSPRFGTQTYVRRFPIPPNVDFARISGAVSQDGVLKVIVPKLPL